MLEVVGCEVVEELEAMFVSLLVFFVCVCVAVVLAVVFPYLLLCC